MKLASLISSALVLLALFHGFLAVAAEDLSSVNDDEEQSLLGPFLEPFNRLVSFLSSLANGGGISSDETPVQPTRGNLVDNLFNRGTIFVVTVLAVLTLRKPS
jgi:hypothetical protein